MSTTRAYQRADPGTLLRAGLLLLLLLSWVAVGWILHAQTVVSVSYDSSWLNYRGWPERYPSAGSWQRELSAFFESSVGVWLPAAFVLLADVGLLGMLINRWGSAARTPESLLLGWGLANLLFVVQNGLGMRFPFAATDLLLGGSTPEGWARTGLFWLPTMALLTLLLILKMR
jgi:hypothetical protein